MGCWEMRHDYGIIDQKKVRLYRPMLFLKDSDLLIFPSKDFQIWHSSIMEFIDGLYQINMIDAERNKSINVSELNLALGVLTNITEEFEQIFDSKKASTPYYQYISTLSPEYKKRRKNSYSSDMRRCDIRIPIKTVSLGLKHQHMMEIVEEAWALFNWAHNKNLKKQNRLTDFDEV